MDSLSHQAVRQVDRWAIEQIGLPGVVLMENAGRQVADIACELLDDPGPRSVAIVAGGGNNGGDGFVLARHLAVRGIESTVYLISPREKLSGDARVNFDVILRLGLPVVDVTAAELPKLAAQLGAVGLVVDAVGGTGISGDLRDPIAEAARQINAAGARVLAVDIPTGLDCDTGLPGSPTVRAAVTVTFVARKAGFDNPASAPYTGRVVVADIGVPPSGDGRTSAK
jgi:NAD(P)H-hydrate epimerase